MRRNVRILASILAAVFLASCNVNLGGLQERANSLWNFKAENLMKPESIKGMAKKLGISDIGDFSVSLKDDNGMMLDFGNTDKIENGIKYINLDKKLAILLSFLKNVDYVEIKYNNEIIKLDRNTLMDAYGLKLEDLTKSKEELQKYLEDALKKN